MYEHEQPETAGIRLFEHIFGEETGFLVTFTGQQARFTRTDARPNELARTIQLSFAHPDRAEEAGRYLIAESRRQRDAYFGVHLYREPGNRRTANAAGLVRSLWLDEDGGNYPEDGPEPTAIVRSSTGRRHLYWRLTHPVAVEWAVGMNRRIAAWARGDSGKAGLSSVLRVPGTWNYKRHPRVDPVSLEMITGEAAWEPEVLEEAIPLVAEGLAEKKRSRRERTEPYDGPRIELLDYLESTGVEILAESPDVGGVKFSIICPWVREHSGGDRTGTYVGQYESGALWFHCHHEHCHSRTWRDLRRKARPKSNVVIRLV